MNTSQKEKYQSLINEVSELNARLEAGKINLNHHSRCMTEISREMRILARQIKIESYNEYGFALRDGRI